MAFHVRVTFAPNDGHVSAVNVDMPTDLDEKEKRCVEGVLRGVKVPPFSDGPVNVGKTYTVEAAR